MDRPKCTFKYFCIFNKSKECTILSEMPKPRKDETCPFAKRHITDIAGKAPTLKKGEKIEEKNTYTTRVDD